MISQVSFGCSCNKLNADYSVNTGKPQTPTSQTHNYLLSVPSSMTNDVEAFCAIKGIKFKRYTSKAEAAADRIKEPEAPYIKTEINAAKFKKLLDTQRATNIHHLASNYNQGEKVNVDKLLSQDEVPATTLSIKHPVQSLIYNTEKTVNTLNQKGIEGLRDDQLVISFEQKTTGPDNLTYFAFLEAGLEKIPVYMDEDTYQIANAAGIIE